MPKQHELGEHVAQQMDALWQKSVRDIDKGVVNEYGATLVKGQDGELKLVNPAKGTSNCVVLNLDVAEGEEFVGTFHTHPHKTAFSDQDFFSVIESQEKVSLVRSGDETYALVRTDLTSSKVDADKVREAYDQEVLRCMMDDPGVSWSGAIYRANIEMCRRYGLAFYRGWGSSLREVYRP